MIQCENHSTVSNPPIQPILFGRISHSEPPSQFVQREMYVTENFVNPMRTNLFGVLDCSAEWSAWQLIPDSATASDRKEPNRFVVPLLAKPSDHGRRVAGALPLIKGHALALRFLANCLNRKPASFSPELLRESTRQNCQFNSLLASELGALTRPRSRCACECVALLPVVRLLLLQIEIDDFVRLATLSGRARRISGENQTQIFLLGMQSLSPDAPSYG
jgi:hypothetical protein